MKRVGIIGLGDMGLAMAKNIIQSGFALTGYDLRAERLEMLEALGGQVAHSPAEVGRRADVVFIMVLNGRQVHEVILGKDGLLEALAPEATIIVSATIKPAEIREVAQPVFDKGLKLIDSAVSGGRAGAEAGTLTMMVAAAKDTFEIHQDILKAVGEKIYHVGEEIGAGQTVKAALQAFIGTTYAGVFEALVLGAKAGVKGEVMFEIFRASSAGSPLFEQCAVPIMNREFKDTGSHIGTMYKDLGITMDMAKEEGVAMFATSAAHELFQSGISLFPDEDNWSIVKFLEHIAGTEVRW